MNKRLREILPGPNRKMWERGSEDRCQKGVFILTVFNLSIHKASGLNWT